MKSLANPADATETLVRNIEERIYAKLNLLFSGALVIVFAVLSLNAMVGQREFKARQAEYLLDDLQEAKGRFRLDVLDGRTPMPAGFDRDSFGAYVPKLSDLTPYVVLDRRPEGTPFTEAELMDCAGGRTIQIGAIDQLVDCTSALPEGMMDSIRRTKAIYWR